MARSPKGNNPDGLASCGVNDGHTTSLHSPDGQKPLFLTFISRRDRNMRSLKNLTDIEKIEAVLCQVRPSFSFVPLKAHRLYVHNICLQSRFFSCPSSAREPENIKKSD